MEVWKDIDGFEGLYQVSNFGNVRGMKRKINLHPETDRGYNRVCLSKNGKLKHYFLHRLVAFAFVSNPFGYTEINHKDENPQNNAAENLEWCCHKYNMNFGTRTKRASASRTGKGRVICQYSLSGKFIKQWSAAMEVQRTLNINHSHVIRCCRGFRPTAGGFRWEYKKEAGM